MDKTYLVLKDAKGFYPLAFITPNDEAGKLRAEAYEKKLDEGESIAEVRIIEV